MGTLSVEAYKLAAQTALETLFNDRFLHGEQILFNTIPTLGSG